jgi:precorrin-4/cobalt-precorrin-4 C11-methyltransferase
MDKVYFAGAGPGDPGLITVKGMDLLSRADLLVYAGSLVSPELVEKTGAPVKLDSQHMSLEELTEAMVSGARQGKLVVRLHSGDPSLYGAIVEQIAELEKHGITVEVVPGVSSMFAAAAALNTQLTLKGVSESVIVTRPAGATLREDQIREFSRTGATLVIFLGTEKIGEIVKKLECPQETPVAVVYHASWPDQKVVRGTVADIVNKVKAAGIEKTALIIVGGVIDPLHVYERSLLYS